MTRLTMRLYRLHDLDLMYLYKMPNISIQSIVKVMLKNYIKDRNSGFCIATRLSIPDIKHDTYLPKSAQFHITLIDGEDDDVISWIEQIPKGMRNSMLKNMLRSYLNFPIVAPYEKEVTKIVPPTEKNNISIEKYNQVMEYNVKNGKKKHIPSSSPTPIPITSPPNNTPFVPEPPTVSPPSVPIVTETSQLTEKPNQTKSSIPQNSEPLNENDFFDDFESMMDNF